MEANEITEQWLMWVDRLAMLKDRDAPEYRSLANDLAEGTVQELATFYNTAVARNDLAVLDAWFQSLDRTVPMCDTEIGIRNLVEFFSFVGRVWGRRPFISQKLARFVTAAVPNWNKLPANLRFLEEPAMAFSKYQFVFGEEGQEYIQQNISAAEIAQLQLTAAKIREVGYSTVKEWYRFRSGVQVEASMVFHLRGCLDAVGLDYYSPGKR